MKICSLKKKKKNALHQLRDIATAKNINQTLSPINTAYHHKIAFKTGFRQYELTLTLTLKGHVPGEEF